MGPLNFFWKIIEILFTAFRVLKGGVAPPPEIWQLPKEFPCACIVELQERERLVYIIGFG